VPTISMFYGIIIRMYCDKAEHNPPHFHAYYQEYKATVNIKTCEMLTGDFPGRQTKMILAWAAIHQDELLADWELATAGTHPFKIEPLK
jgi:hypothetical protein